MRMEDRRLVSARGRQVLPLKPALSPRRRPEATNVDLLDLIDPDEINVTPA